MEGLAALMRTRRDLQRREYAIGRCSMEQYRILSTAQAQREPLASLHCVYDAVSDMVHLRYGGTSMVPSIVSVVMPGRDRGAVARRH